MSKQADSATIFKPTHKELIENYDLKKHSNLGLLWIIIGLFLLAVILWKTQQCTHIDFKDGCEIIVTVAVALIAYSQWRAARHEISIDKYYDRLDNANNRLEKLSDVDFVVLHVFAEIDKLEYVLMKYKIGFMPVDLVFRAIENFKSLCQHRNNFHSCASEYIAKAAYLPETKVLVLKILKENLPDEGLKQSCGDKNENSV